MPPEQNALAATPPAADPTPPAADPTPPATPATPTDPPAADPPAATDPPADPTSLDDGPDPGEGGDAQHRIRRLLAENKALREYGTHWRGMALTRGEQPPPETPATPAAPKPAPKLKDFDSTEAWAEAHSAWASDELDRRTAAAVEKHTSARETATREATVQETYAARMDAFEKERPDARLVIANPTMTRAIQTQPAIAEVVQASEVGPQMAVHLSENPTELVRISRLPASQAAAALGRLEGELLAKRGAAPTPPKPGTKPAAPATPAKPATPPVSRAPAPPTPIGGGGNPTVDDMDLPLEDFLAKINRGKKPARR